MTNKTLYKTYNVSAVLVTYMPNLDTLRTAIQAISKQVRSVFIIDNASFIIPDDFFEGIKDQSVDTELHLLKQNENLGIAAAQNIGIEKAIKSGADFVWLLDQDSIPLNSMVKELIEQLIEEQSVISNLPIAAVGPAIVDRRSGFTSPFVVKNYGFPRRWLPNDKSAASASQQEVDFLISSGTLIPVNVIKDIGAMRSNYFIDHVDTEWCFRAKAAGYRLLGVPKSRLTHEIGDKVKQIWFFGSRQVMYHAPLRDYYMFRNTLLMLQDTPMSWIWCVYFLWRLLQFSGYFLMFAGDRYQRLCLMALGLIHGFKRISGRLDVKTGQCMEIPVSHIKSDFTDIN